MLDSRKALSNHENTRILVFVLLLFYEKKCCRVLVFFFYNRVFHSMLSLEEKKTKLQVFTRLGLKWSFNHGLSKGWKDQTVSGG